MWPWGHLAVGYLCYSMLSHLRFRRSPTGRATLLVVFGTQLPDLIDKPLAWTFGILPSGRSLAHSLFFAAAIVGFAYLYSRRRGQSELGIAFGVGYLSHLFSDALPHVIHGDYVYLSFLGWPVLPPAPYGVEAGLIEHFARIEFTPLFIFQITLGAITVLLWLYDGHPGLTALHQWVSPEQDRYAE